MFYFSYYLDRTTKDEWSMDHRFPTGRDHPQPHLSLFHSTPIPWSTKTLWVPCMQMIFSNFTLDKMRKFPWKEKNIFIKHSYHETLAYGNRRRNCALAYFWSFLSLFEPLSLSRVIKVSKHSAGCRLLHTDGDMHTKHSRCLEEENVSLSWIIYWNWWRFYWNSLDGGHWIYFTWNDV